MEKKLCIYSEVKNVQEVEKIIDDISSEFTIAQEVYGNILISSIEATNNAIIHGNKSDKNKKVEIIIKKNEKKLTISVKDEGPGFDFSSIPDPTTPDNIEKVNGRGIFIMSKLADELNFYENGKRVELTFNI